MERIKNNLPILVIGMLIIIILYQFITSRKYQSEYSKYKTDTNTIIEQLRSYNIKASDRVRELQETIKTMAGTIHDIGSTAQNISGSVNTAAGYNTDARVIIAELKKFYAEHGQCSQ